LESVQIKQRFGHFALLTGSLALVALASLLFHSHFFRGLGTEALDLAQLGRNISGGQGFTTGVLRPLLWPATGGVMPFPEQTHAPLWSFLLGWVFPFAGARDGVVVAFSFAIFLLSAIVLFALAFRLSGDRAIAFLTVCAYGLAPTALSLAGAGRPIVLSTLLLLAMLLVLTPKTAALDFEVDARKSEKTGSEKQLSKIFFLAGALAALCYLTEYISIFYTLPLAIVWGKSHNRWNKRTVIAFAIGFVLLALPWWIRNIRLFGNPFATSQWLEIAMNTAPFPGLSAYGDVGMTGTISEQLRPNAEAFIRKIGSAFMTHFVQAPYALPLYLLPFSIASLWVSGRTRHASLFKIGIFLSLALLCFVLSFLDRTAPAYLLPLVPLLAYLGVSTYGRLWNNAPAANPRAAEESTAAAFPNGLKGVGAFALLLLVLVLPPAWNVLSSPAAPASTLASQWQQRARMTSEKKILVTDVPAEAAWYGERPAAWLPRNPKQIPRLEKLLGSETPGAVYLSSRALNDPANDFWLLWQREGGDLPHYERRAGATAENTALPGALYVRFPTPDEALKLARAQPKSAQAQEMLGRARLEAKQYAPALASFQAAQKLKSDWYAPALGAGRAALNLRQYNVAQRQFGMALQRRAPSGAAIQALMGLGDAYMAQSKPGQAAAAYQKVLTISPQNSLALNNLAYVYVEGGGSVDRALEMSQRAVASNPRSAPIWDTFGWVLLRSGRPKNAIDALQKSIQIAPNNAISQYHLGCALFVGKQRAEAHKALNLAIAIGLPPKEEQTAEAILRR